MAKWLLAIAAVGCAVIWAIPGGAADPGDKKSGPDDADIKATIEFNAKVIDDALGKEKVTKGLKLKAHTAALMIAAVAQSGGASRNAQLAAQRDAALKIAKAIDDGKLADARTAAKDLPSLKPDANAKMDPVPLIDKEIKMDDIMTQFQSERSGGLNLEDKLGAWEDKLPETLSDVSDAANQLSTIFELIRGHKANLKLGTQDQWEKFSDAARAKADELRTVTSKGNKDDTKKAVKAANASCIDCHKVFRPRPSD